jgi:cytidylate kinase
MAIITISRGSYSRGKRIAERVADRLGYECIARETILEASKEYNVPEVKLAKAMHDAPTFFDRFTGGRERFVAYFQAALAEHVKRDNIVYHGLAGHFLLKDIPHVVKVRIIADLDYRITVVKKRKNVSKEEARAILAVDDEARNKWSRMLWGVDQTDSNLYDAVIHIHRITVDNAVDIICQITASENFKTTPKSQNAMENLALATKVKAHLIGIKTDIEVEAKNGIILVKTVSYYHSKANLTAEIKRLASAVSGVEEVNVKIDTIPWHS